MWPALRAAVQNSRPVWPAGGVSFGKGTSVG